MPIKEKHLRTIYLTLGLLALAYVVARAYRVGVTYDEVWTLVGFVPQNFLDIIRFNPSDANNHIINTLLIKFFFVFGNHSLFVARLPNILACVVYLYFGYKICSKYLSPFLGLSCYLMLLLNPFLLDFFSIARGYGLALGFQLASMYFLIHYVAKHKTKHAVWSLILGALAVLSSFSWLNYWIVIFVLINAVALGYRKQFNTKRVLAYTLIVAVMLLLIIFEPLRKLQQGDSLYYGGSDNFISDTLLSLTKYSMYTAEVCTWVHVVLYGFMGLFLLAAIVSFAGKRNLYSVRNLVLLIMVLCSASVVVQHYIFGTLYLIDRTALFFYPLLILGLFFSLQEIKLKWFSRVLACVFVALFAFNFFSHANFYKTAIWYFDARTKETLRFLNDKGKAQNKVIKIDFSWPFESSFGYYMATQNYPYVEIVKNREDREDMNPNADYYIYLQKSLEKVGYESSMQKIWVFQSDTARYYDKDFVVVFSNLEKK